MPVAMLKKSYRWLARQILMILMSNFVISIEFFVSKFVDELEVSQWVFFVNETISSKLRPHNCA